MKAVERARDEMRRARAEIMAARDRLAETARRLRCTRAFKADDMGSVEAWLIEACDEVIEDDLKHAMSRLRIDSQLSPEQARTLGDEMRADAARIEAARAAKAPSTRSESRAL